MNHLQNNYLECAKTGWEGMIANLLLVSYKYHINTMKIIKLFRVNIFIPITKFPYLTILLFCERRSFRIFDQFRGLFKETNDKILGDYVGKGRENIWMFKVAKSCHKVTWAQKKVTKKRELNYIFNFKIFKWE